jgi:site-specific recombinase XerC
VAAHSNAPCSNHYCEQPPLSFSSGLVASRLKQAHTPPAFYCEFDLSQCEVSLVLHLSRGPYWHPPHVHLQRPPLPIPNRTNVELAQKFSEWVIAQRYARVTQLAYKRVAFRFCHFLGRRCVVSANHLDVRSFLVEVMKRDLSVDGYNRHLWALRRFFDFLFMGGIVDSVAPRFVIGRRHARPMPRILGESDVNSLIRATTNPRDRAILELLYSTGCRVGELVRIRVEDIDRTTRTIRVASKGWERTVFFGSHASSALRKYLNGRKNGPLFQPKHSLRLKLAAERINSIGGHQPSRKGTDCGPGVVYDQSNRPR